MSQSMSTGVGHVIDHDHHHHTDRVHWGPIFAGLFAAMSVLVILGMLGAAIGLSAADAGDDVRDFGIGAGIWGAISALVAFFFGGWVAACTTSYNDNESGMLQGAMVWMVAIPLMIYLLAGGISNIARMGAQVASNPQITSELTRDINNTATSGTVTTPDRTLTNNNTQRADEAADRAATVTWGMLISLLLGLGAAAVGGQLGSRADESRRHVTTRSAAGM